MLIEVTYTRVIRYETDDSLEDELKFIREDPPDNFGELWDSYEFGEDVSGRIIEKEER